ncbi:NBS resistance protein, partial [Trifolium medium]|nr:NBS resistance protein [Trifolium medium]
MLAYTAPVETFIYADDDVNSNISFTAIHELCAAIKLSIHEVSVRQHTLFEIASVIGTPLTLDEPTKNRTFGHYARILVEVQVEREGFAFKLEVVYERLPDFGHHCHAIGHHILVCKWIHPPQLEQKLHKPIVHSVHNSRIRRKHPDTPPVAVVIASDVIHQNTGKLVITSEGKQPVAEPVEMVKARHVNDVANRKLVFLVELMIRFDQVPSLFWRSISFDKYCVNDRAPFPNLWCLWHSSLNPVVLFVSSQCIIIEVLSLNNRNFVAAIYAIANASYIVRRQLLTDLTNLQNQFQGPWMFLGDFNTVLGAHAKRGKRLPPKVSCEDFLLWTNTNQLTHIKTIGVHYTWANGRAGNEYAALCLDRAICNHDWFTQWNAFHCCALFQHCSDHHPILVSQQASTS